MSATSTDRGALERGKRDREADRIHGRAYGKVHGAYPGNPFHRGDPQFEEYNAGYAEGHDATKERT